MLTADSEPRNTPTFAAAAHIKAFFTAYACYSFMFRGNIPLKCTYVN